MIGRAITASSVVAPLHRQRPDRPHRTGQQQHPPLSRTVRSTISTTLETTFVPRRISLRIYHHFHDNLDAFAKKAAVFPACLLRTLPVNIIGTRPHSDPAGSHARSWRRQDRFFESLRHLRQSGVLPTRGDAATADQSLRRLKDDVRADALLGRPTPQGNSVTLLQRGGRGPGKEVIDAVERAV